MSENQVQALEEIIPTYVEQILGLLPRKTPTSSGQTFIAMLTFRQMATFQGIGVLLSHGLHSEASALIRRLLEDNLRLAHIAAHPDDADGLYYGHLREQLRRRVVEVEKLVAAGVNAEPLLAEVTSEYEGWERAHEEGGEPRVVGFPKVEQMIRSLRRWTDILPWVAYSPAVHSCVTIEDHPREGEPKEFALTSRDKGTRRNLVAIAGRYFFESYSAGSALLGYETESKKVFDLYGHFMTALNRIASSEG